MNYEVGRRTFSRSGLCPGWALIIINLEGAVNKYEAQEWLRGERSSVNYVPKEPLETWQERIATTDLAMIQQAYWVAKASMEGLIV